MKIMVVEDDRKIIDFLRTLFGVSWPEAQMIIASEGEKGVDLAKTEKPNIILLDLGLPDISGFDVLKRIRLFSAVPIIIITVSGEETYVVRGLALGADDYVTKPLRPLELIARMKSLVQKRSFEEDTAVSCGDIRFGSSLHELFRGDKRIILTTAEGRIMSTLMKNAGKAASYTQLAKAVCGEYYPGAENSLKSHIRHLRQKIEVTPSQPQLILNSPGIGYLLSCYNTPA